MKRIPVLAICAALTGCAMAPWTRFSKDMVHEPRPLYLSSFGGDFPVQCRVDGTFQVNLQNIQIDFRSVEIRVKDYASYHGDRQLTALKIGLATALPDGKWKSLKLLDAARLDQTVAVGNVVRFTPTPITVPIGESLDLSQCWLLVAVESIASDLPSADRRPGLAYAHSEHEIFVR